MKDRKGNSGKRTYLIETNLKKTGGEAGSCGNICRGGHEDREAVEGEVQGAAEIWGEESEERVNKMERKRSTGDKPTPRARHEISEGDNCPARLTQRRRR